MGENGTSQADMEYSITFDLPKCRVDALKTDGRQAEVEQATATKIELPLDDNEKADEEEDPYCTKSVSVVGALLGIYAAHLTILQKINEIEKQEQEDSNNLDDLSTDELKAKIRELQAQLAEAKRLGFVPEFPNDA